MHSWGVGRISPPVACWMRFTIFDSDTAWPFWRPGFVLLPAGRHLVSADRPWFRLLDLSGLRPQLLQLTGGLVSGTARRGLLAAEYDSDSRVIARLGRRPATILVDGASARGVEPQADGSVVVVLPAGHHRMEATGSGGASVVVDFVSVISSSLIVAFGTAASLVLVGLYAWIRVRRFFRAS